jgi:hypothetical protein
MNDFFNRHWVLDSAAAALKEKKHRESDKSNESDFFLQRIKGFVRFARFAVPAYEKPTPKTPGAFEAGCL